MLTKVKTIKVKCNELELPSYHSLILLPAQCNYIIITSKIVRYTINIVYVGDKLPTFANIRKQTKNNFLLYYI